MALISTPVDVQDPTPQIHRYGMFNAAFGPLAMPPHAIGGGVRYQTVTTDLPHGFDVSCATSSVTMTDPCGDFVTASPFLVQATIATTKMGISDEEMRSLLLQRLTAGERTVVESIFCSGLNGAAPSLVNNTPLATTLAAAASVVDGMGALEEWLYAQYGPRGVLHIPLALAPRVHALGAIVKDRDVWRTALGTAVSFGNYTGYDADGDAPAAGHTNFYVTGSLTIWAEDDSEIVIPGPDYQVLNPVTNQYANFARRGYLVAHNGLLACVDVDIDGA